MCLSRVVIKMSSSCPVSSFTCKCSNVNTQIFVWINSSLFIPPRLHPLSHSMPKCVFCVCVPFTLYFAVSLFSFPYCSFSTSLNLHLCNRPKLLLHPLTQVHTVHDVVSVKPFISFKRMFQVQATLRFLVVCRT